MTSSLRMFAAVIVSVALLLQAATSHAEQIGLWECPSHHHHADSDQTSDHPEKPFSADSDCHCFCHQPVFFPVSAIDIMVSALPRESTLYSTIDERCPDGPVRAIDHPPQLS